MDFFRVILHEAPIFTDKSLALKEYDTPATSLELTTAGFIYIGLYKEFDSFFLELATKSIAGAELSAEYFDGSDWSALALYDETNGLSKSGFMYFEKPANFANTTIDGKNAYYIRLKANIATGAVTAKLLDVLFSSDNDLIKIRENIVSKFSTAGTWISKHIAARDHIIQELRNRGNIKTIPKDNGVLGEVEYLDLTKFDFLEPLQLRLSSTYLAFYFIFWYELSDEEGDKWQLKAAEMYRLYEDTMKTFYLILDLNDNGVKDDSDVAVRGDAIRTMILR